MGFFRIVSVQMNSTGLRPTARIVGSVFREKLFSDAGGYRRKPALRGQIKLDGYSCRFAAHGRCLARLLAIIGSMVSSIKRKSVASVEAPTVKRRVTAAAAEKPSKQPKAQPKEQPGDQPSDQPFLRFTHSQALRKQTLKVLLALEQSDAPDEHRADLADIVVTLMSAGMDFYFLAPLKQAKAGFVIQQSANLGMVGVQQLMGGVIRNIIGRMERPALLSVCGSIRSMML
ncbi:PT domain-containing protein [Roseateles oligotrophus]|uniref:PT domain-containing protein n=1 Tax=Roseateles oligotrophus TaxID=1769250 RepID=A0ABT2YLH8_9BURK|nr:PT domain-containing protein [Roseateles oligotrophus]MCV2370922.1 PT domain-containing protein [Roseateles oligotrophus]